MNTQYSVRFNETCTCENKITDCSQRSVLGTEASCYKADTKSTQVSLSKIFGVAFGKTWKVHPATTMKDVIIDDWVYSFQKDASHDPEPAFLDYFIVVEMSNCRGHSRRVSFWDILKNQRIKVYISQTFDDEVLKLIDRFANEDSFVKVWSRMSDIEKAAMKRVVKRIVQNTKGTGVVYEDCLQVWDVSSKHTLGPNGIRVRTSWGSMVKDTESTATFAVMTDICFDYVTNSASSLSSTAARTSSPNTRPIKSYLYTRVCVTINGCIQAGNVLEQAASSKNVNVGIRTAFKNNRKISKQEDADSRRMQSSKLNEDNYGFGDIPQSSRIKTSGARVQTNRYNNARENYNSDNSGLSLTEELDYVKSRMDDRLAKARDTTSYGQKSPYQRSKQLSHAAVSIDSPLLNVQSRVEVPKSDSKPSLQSSSKDSGSLFLKCEKALRFRDEKGQDLGTLFFHSGQHNRINLDVSNDHLVYAKWQSFGSFRTALASLEKE